MATTSKAKATKAEATTSTKTKAKTTETETAKTAVEDKGGVTVATEYVKSAAETAVDVPVGAALSAADRVGELNTRFNTQTKRETELRRVRNQFRRELNKVERRGGSARKRALQSAKRTRTKVEREVKARRRSAETTLRQQRRSLESSLKRNRTEAEKRVREASERVQALV